MIERLIRGGIGFEGVLVSDDLAMGALSGPVGPRAAAAVMAGCDLALHCSGRLAETEAVLEAVPDVTALTRLRMARGREMADRCRLQLDWHALVADQDAMFA